MPSRTDHLQAALAKIVEDFRQRELFTDLYFEVGNLRAVQPTIVFERYEGDRPKIFDLASLTKALVTYPLVLDFLERHGIHSSKPLRVWFDKLPSLGADLLDLTPAAILSHTSGLPAWRNFWIERLDGRDSRQLLPSAGAHVEKVLARYPSWVKQPGKETYSDIGFILLAYCLNFAEKQNLNELWDAWRGRRGFSKDAKFGFGLRESFEPRDFALSGFCKLRGRELRGEVHDENCAALGGVAGHAGLFGSGGALSAYLRKFLIPWLGPPLPKPLSGFRPGDEDFVQRTLGKEAAGHWGFTGTGFWFDPISQNFLVLLTNRTYRYRVTPMIREFRAAMIDAAGPLFAR